MRPVGQSYGRNRLSDTQPMPAAEIRAKYNAYRQTIDRRREVLRTPQPQPARRNPRTSAKTKYEKYFDYDLLLVIVFLMCFGLVMLYSTSAYEADADFGNDLYYFIRQALIAAAGFVVMFVVSKIDYHIYGAFAFEIYIFAMFMMALVQDAARSGVQRRQKVDTPSGQPDSAACGDNQDRGDPLYRI